MKTYEGVGGIPDECSLYTVLKYAVAASFQITLFPAYHNSLFCLFSCYITSAVDMVALNNL